MCVSVSTRCVCFSEYRLCVFQRVPAVCVSASTRCVCFSEYPVRVFQRVPGACVSASTGVYLSEYRRVFQRVPSVSASTQCFSEYRLHVFQRVPAACVSASTGGGWRYASGYMTWSSPPTSSAPPAASPSWRRTPPCSGCCGPASGRAADSQPPTDTRDADKQVLLVHVLNK